MESRRIYHLLLALLIAISSIMPANTAIVSANAESIIPVNWPSDNNWYSYQDGNGNPILDIAGEVSPSDTDITSGVDNGFGKLPSVYVASDGNNLFVRYRMKSNPYDRKGGFLSTAWVVKIIKDIDGVPTQVATVGLDGKSPSVDYVYVANGDGSKVKPIYQTGVNTDNKSEPFPGTRITPADNGHYFLDFQVPISEIAAISDAQDILGLNEVMLYFGTSKAANLSVINKEWMSEDQSYNNLREIGLKSPGDALGIQNTTDIAYPTITIDNLAGTKDADGHFTSNDITVTGSVSEDLPISVGVNGMTIPITPINGNWSINLSNYIDNVDGIYDLEAYVTKKVGGKDIRIKTVTSFSIIKSTVEVLYIKSPNTSTISNPQLFGTYDTANEGNDIRVYVRGKLIGNATKKNNTNWSMNLSPNELVNGLNEIKVEIYKTTGQSTIIYATAIQQLNYIQDESTIVTPLSVKIDSVTQLGSATPTISGKSTSAKTVEVQAIDQDGNVKTIEVITPSMDGSWSTFIERPLSTGNYTIKAIAINESSNEVAIATGLHTVNQLAITIDNGAGPIITNNNSPTLRGGSNAPNDSVITVEFAGTTYNTTSQSGRWEVDVPLNPPISNGDFTIIASVTSNEITAVASQELTIDATTEVAITTPMNNPTITDNKKPVLSGTAEAGASVNVVVTNSKSEVVLAKNFENGENWSFVPENDLEYDLYYIKALAADFYGNTATATSMFTIGSGQVVVGELTLVESTDSGLKNDKHTNNGYPELKFTGESGLTIILEGSNGNPLTKDTHYSVTEDNGEYTVTLLDANSIIEDNQPFGTYQQGIATGNPAHTVDGTYTIKAEKVGAQTVTIGTFLIDTTSPATIPTVVSQTSPTSTPTISGTATLEPGDALTVTIDGTTYTVGDRNLSNNGANWTLTIPAINALSEGVYDVVATVTDVAGNKKNDTTTNELTVNMTISIGGLLLTEPTDSGVKGDLITNVGKPVLEFTGESGLTIILEGADNLALTQNQHYTVNYSDGKYSVILIDANPSEGNQPFGTYQNGTQTNNPRNTADGTYTIKVKKAGGQTVTVGSFNIDTTSPATMPTVVSETSPTSTPTITGTATLESGDVLTVTIDGVTYTVGDGKLSFDGSNWTLTIPNELSEGVYDVVATVTDVAGNQKNDTTTNELTVNMTISVGGLLLTEPTNSGVKGDLITNVGKPVLEFTGEAGLTIILEGADNIALTQDQHYTVNYSDGKYSVTLNDANPSEGNQPFGTYQNGTQTNNPRNTADGTYTIKVKKAGGQTVTVGTFNIDTTSPAIIPTVVSETSPTSTPTISGTATLEPGDVLTVTINSVTYTVEDGKLSINGENWTLNIPANNALSEGVYDVVATVTDVAGNQKNDTTDNELTVNMTISVGGLLLTEPTDSGVKGDLITNVGKPVLEFTGESGLTIILEGPGDTALTQDQYYTVNYSDGKYSVTLIDAKPLLEGVQPFGTYNNGIPTGNPTNTADGTYKIKVGKSILQPVQVGMFEIRTSILPPQISVSTDDTGKVTVNGAIPGATVILYNKDGEVVNTVVANNNGLATFIGVPGNIDYYVTQTYEGLTSTPSNKINVVQVFGSEDGAKTVTVLGATPGETVILYTKSNAEVARANADDTGKFIFKEVSPDKDYYVTQMIHNLESSPSNKVDVYPRISVRFSEGDIWESITKEAFVIKESASDIITWKSSNEEVLKVNTNHTTNSVFPEYIVEVDRQTEDVNVILTAKTIKEGKTIERTFLLVVKGLNGNETKTTLPSNNEVKVNGQIVNGEKELLDIDVTRTALTRNGVTQYIDKLILRKSIENENGNPVVIDFSDSPQDSNIIADEITAEIQVDALSQMVQEPLTIATPEGSISLSEQSLQEAVRRGIDLFYRIVPLRTESAKQRVINEHENLMAQEAGNKTYRIIGFPREIVTNYTEISTDVILPLNGLNIPVDQVNNLRVLIEHSDEERIVRIGNDPLDGEIIYTNGQPVGIKFTVSKFSTFTIFQVVDQPNTDGGAPVPIPSLPPEPKVDFHKGYMRGYPDGMFKPENNVTRGQMAAMLARNLGYDESVKVLTNPYLDVKVSNWAANAIQFIEDEGLMVGYPDGTFRPDAPITRAEMATIVTRIKKIEVTETSIGTFKDNSNHWATSVIEANKKIGILVGYPDGTFKPNDNLSRAEATKVVNRIFERGPLYGITKPNWPDVSTTHWAYHEIEEASQDHFFTIWPEVGENIVK